MAARPKPPTGEWLTLQLRRAEQHAAAVEPLLAAAIAEVLADAGAVAARGFTARATSLTAAAPLPSSTMICLKPRPGEAQALALPDGEAAEILHVTLAYLGDTVGPLGWLVDVLRPFAMAHAALEGVVGGIGSFTDMGDGYPILALPDVPGLNELRADLVAALTAAGVAYSTDHGFCPHITLAYGPAPVFAAEAIGVPLTFGDLIVVRGDTEIIPLPLSGAPLAASADPSWAPSHIDEGLWEKLQGLRAAGRTPLPADGAATYGPHAHLHATNDATVHALEPVPGATGWWVDLAPIQPLLDRLEAEKAAEPFANADLFDELAAVAAMHAPDGGYGETYWHPYDHRVFWVCGDWTTNDEIDAAEADFLAIDGVDEFEAGAEAYPTSWVRVYSRPSDHSPGLVGGLVQRFAPGDAPWIPPGGDEIVDVQALIARITARSKPVRDAAVRAAVQAGLGVEMTLEEALAYYHSPKAFDLNAALRDGKALTAEQRAVIETLDAAFKPAAADVVLYRGSPDVDRVYGKDADGLMRGLFRQVSTPGYLSTSTELDDALIFASGQSAPGDRPVVERLVVRKGTPVLHVPAGDYGDQHEWLLPRETEREFRGARDIPDPYEGGTLKRLESTAVSEGRLGLGGGGPKGFGISFDVTNPLVGRVLAQSGSQIVDIAHTTQLNVMRIIRASYAEGLSIPHTAQAIREGMAEAAPARARLIARTELAGAVNGGSLAAVRVVEHATGIAYHKVWMTAPGAKHPRHYRYDGLNGQARRLPEKFAVGGAELDHPGDSEGPPGEICNCRCAMRYGEGPPPPPA